MAVLDFPESPSTPDRVLARLSSAIDEIHEIALSCLDIDEVESLTAGLLRQGERLASATSASVTECDRIGLARRRGSCGSTNAHLATFTHGPTAAIAPSRTNGLWLLDFPDLAGAWGAGIITEAHVLELRRADNPRVHQLLIRDQQLHIDAASKLEFSEWLSHLAYWLLHADPDGSLPRDEQTRYGLKFRTNRNGDVDVSGKLDPLAGEALLNMVEREAAKIRRDELEADVPPSEQSSVSRRNMIGLLRVCTRGFQRADGSWPAPLINVVMSQNVLEDLISRMLDGDDHDPVELPLAYDDVDRRCENIRGTPIEPRRLWPALITGWLRRQVLNAPNRKVNLGHDVRLFNAAQKQALLVEARGRCQVPGCDAPFTWLQADHVHPAGKGGLTNLADGEIKCEPDNLRKSDRTDLR